MVHRGKHEIQGKYVKNNPKISERKFKRIVAFSVFLLYAAAVVIGMHLDDKITSSNDSQIVLEVSLNGYEKIFNELYEEYEVDNLLKSELDESLKYPINKHDSSATIMLEYIESELSSSKYNDEEKEEIINGFLNHTGEIRNDSIDYVKEIVGFSSDLDTVPYEDVDQSKLDLILNDQELIHYIDKYSKAYKIPKSLMVAIAAQNYGLSSSNPMGISDGWRNITSSHTVYEFTDNDESISHEMLKYKDNCLSNMEKNVEYAAIVTYQCFKNAGFNGNFKDVVRDYLPNSNSTDEQINEIINYMFLYEKDRQITIEYYLYSDISKDFKLQSSQLFSSKYSEYLENLYNEVTISLYYNFTNNNQYLKGFSK